MHYDKNHGVGRNRNYVNMFEGPGKWYKGNLHTHTTRSDGAFPPKLVVEFYRRFGYDFISITDHHVYTNDPSLSTEDFIVLPGIEFDVSWMEAFDRQGIAPYICFHENAILWDFDNKNQLQDNYRESYSDVFPKGTKLKEGISLFNEKYQSLGNMVMLNHPVWSRQFCADSHGIRGIFAIEIFNNAGELSSKTGLSVAHWDYCLRQGQRLFGVATDDFHLGLEPRGFIMVKTDDFSPKGVALAIKQGRFYSSCGPEIYGFCLEGNTVVIECSPVKRIRFIKYEPLGVSVQAGKGEYLTRAETKVSGAEKYIRAEIVDEFGYCAWTNPIFPHDESPEV